MTSTPSIQSPVQMAPLDLIQPGRRITGMSAILLPFSENGSVAWEDFERHLRRTLDAGLVPAVNMDTGYANLIDETTRLEVLKRTSAICQGSRFVAGVFVRDQAGAPFDADAYRQGIEDINAVGGTPIFFQSYGLTGLGEDELIAAYRQLGEACNEFLFFELGTMFAPFGKIYSLGVYRELLNIPAAIGAKHSSLHRQPEWERLILRNQVRPDFMVLTGNDLAIDMVTYGSDYLLGISTFAPELFAKRDGFWADGDPAFYELNDLLQYLGFFAFRDPVPAYKHSAAQFLHAAGQLQTSNTHPDSPKRPDTDVVILKDVLARLSEF